MNDKLTGGLWLTLVLQRWYFLAVPVQVMLSFPAAAFFLWTENKYLDNKLKKSKRYDKK